MRKILLRVFAILISVVPVGLAALGIYVARTWNRTYDAPLPEVRISRDPEVLARGEYLVFGPAHCVACHGSSAANKQIAEGPEPLSGGLRFALGPLGAIYAANLTPDGDTGIGRYSDGQIARMMRWAVKPDGHATIEPLMPFGNLSEDDLAAVISYLRAQAPVRNAVPTGEWTLMGKVVKSLAGVFKPRATINPPATSPAQAPTKERGEYLARYVSNCVGCHTPRDENTFVATGPEFSGGMKMEPAAMPGVDASVWFISPNLTPQAGSALLKFPDRETFVARFRNGGRHYAGSPMPWDQFARMTPEDVGALYEFLHTLSPQDGPTGEPTFKPE